VGDRICCVSLLSRNLHKVSFPAPLRLSCPVLSKALISAGRRRQCLFPLASTCRRSDTVGGYGRNPGDRLSVDSAAASGRSVMRLGIDAEPALPGAPERRGALRLDEPEDDLRVALPDPVFESSDDPLHVAG